LFFFFYINPEHVFLQVAQLRVENSSLLKQLANISQKYNESAVDNRVLKADIETLRAKVTFIVLSLEVQTHTHTHGHCKALITSSDHSDTSLSPNTRTGMHAVLKGRDFGVQLEAENWHSVIPFHLVIACIYR
jgi:regulator of replication initiation timing